MRGTSRLRLQRSGNLPVESLPPDTAFVVNDIHSHYLQELDLANRPLINRPKPESQESRLAECERITRLFDENERFSFLRLGDMELTLLLAHEDGLKVRGESEPDEINGTQPSGGPGLGFQHIERLYNSFGRASYIDYHQLLTINERLVPRLRLRREAGAFSNPDRETSYILPTWMLTCFKAFVESRNRPVCIAGAEASLLEWLSGRDAFREAAGEIWPDGSRIIFHQVRDNGRNLEQNLDLIKEDLKELILKHDIGTLFLSLGGGAKILCVELAGELGIRAIDFGATIRSLCDLGSDGHLSGRSSHSIIFHRLPFSLVMKGMEATRPDLLPEERLAKAHAQMIHELRGNDIGVSSGSRQLDFSPESRMRFRRAHRDYKRQFAPLFRKNAACARERARFLHFCGSHRLTCEGTTFYIRFLAKDRLKGILGKG